MEEKKKNFKTKFPRICRRKKGKIIKRRFWILGSQNSLENNKAEKCQQLAVEHQAPTPPLPHLTFPSSIWKPHNLVSFHILYLNHQVSLTHTQTHTQKHTREVARFTTEGSKALNDARPRSEVPRRSRSCRNRRKLRVCACSSCRFSTSPCQIYYRHYGLDHMA